MERFICMATKGVATPWAVDHFIDFRNTTIDALR